MEWNEQLKKPGTEAIQAPQKSSQKFLQSDVFELKNKYLKLFKLIYPNLVIKTQSYRIPRIRIHLPIADWQASMKVYCPMAIVIAKDHFVIMALYSIYSL